LDTNCAWLHLPGLSSDGLNTLRGKAKITAKHWAISASWHLAGGINLD